MDARFSLVLACVVGAGFALFDVERDLAKQRDLHRAAYASSRECTRCHTDHAESFARTFHRTMTQAASRASVVAPFAGETLDYFGVTARMERKQTGEFVVRYGGTSFPEQTFVVAMTVGSRRYQQYVAEARDGSLVRLPVAYHIDEKRWFHMNGAFLTPDPTLTESALAQTDYERHVTRWNDNCVFCHNVSPNPGMVQHGERTTFATHVAELGVACEACHGPGAEHAQTNANPLRRYRLHLSDHADPTIVNPARLSPARATDVCGRCHGQRITDDVERFLTQGDPFVPGDDLALYSAPLWRDTPLQGQANVFAPRFWGDGTPRLTAYEYQGLLMSACATQGALTCTSCHGMHEGDPRGQIRPTKQGAAMCTGCHTELASEMAQRDHARHERAGEQPSCTSCHMPDIVYGVLSVHPTHRIERPDPARSAVEERPDACTNCHVDKTRAWAAEERARLWSPSQAPMPEVTVFSEIETRLLAGDPIERALAAAALGNQERAPTLDAVEAARVRALLLDVLVRDPYPVVRRFAARSLAARVSPASEAHALLVGFVPETPLSDREAFGARLAALVAPASLDKEALSLLRAEAETLAIEIGE